MKLLRLFSLAVLLSCTSGLVWASEEPSKNVIWLSAQADATVPRDVMEARFLVTAEDADHQTASLDVTERTNKLLELIKSEPDVEIASTSRDGYAYNTASSKLVSTRKMVWVDNSRVVVSSRKPDALAKLVAKVQSVAALENLSSRVSDVRRQSLDNQLIEEALTTFRAKAELVTKSLGFSSYEIVRLELGGGGIPGPMVNYRAKQANSYFMEDASMAPDLEAGTAKLRMDVSGTIRLVK